MSKGKIMWYAKILLFKIDYKEFRSKDIKYLGEQLHIGLKNITKLIAKFDDIT